MNVVLQGWKWGWIIIPNTWLVLINECTALWLWSYRVENENEKHSDGHVATLIIQLNSLALVGLTNTDKSFTDSTLALFTQCFKTNRFGLRQDSLQVLTPVRMGILLLFLNSHPDSSARMTDSSTNSDTGNPILVQVADPDSRARIPLWLFQ